MHERRRQCIPVHLVRVPTVHDAYEKKEFSGVRPLNPSLREEKDWPRPSRDRITKSGKSYTPMEVFAANGSR